MFSITVKSSAIKDDNNDHDNNIGDDDNDEEYLRLGKDSKEMTKRI